MTKVTQTERERIYAACTTLQARVLIDVLEGVSMREIARATGKGRTTIRDHYNAALDNVRRAENGTTP